MAQPLLSIDLGSSKPKVIANLLPCRVHHDGPINDAASFWKPTKAQDGMSLSYLRGRKLHGKTVALPENYRGVLVKHETTDKTPDMVPSQHDEEDEQAQGPPTSAMQVTAEFDEMVVWGHEAMADAHDDPFVRSLEEWLQVAEKIHGYGDKSGASTQK